MAAVSVVRSGVILLVLFLISLFILYSIAKLLSNNAGDSVTLKFPLNIQDIRQLVTDVQTIQEDNKFLVYLLFSLTYLFKQTFSIPGSALLNLFAGAVFGSWIGFPIVCVLAATGASMCFLLSKLLGQELVEVYLKERIAPLTEKVKGQQDGGLGEFLLLVSLRLFPATPNWLMNLSLPHIGVNLIKFFFSVLVGLMPYNFLCVQTGLLLTYTADIGAVMDYKTSAILTLSSLTLIAMVIGMRKFKSSTKQKSL